MWCHFYHYSYCLILNQSNVLAYKEQRQHKTRNYTVGIRLDWKYLQNFYMTHTKINMLIMLSVFHIGPPSYSDLQNPLELNPNIEY